MPLVIQLYCPLPHSSLERVIYVFACPRTACQKKRSPRSPGEGPGCVRAWRANGWWREGEEAKLREREERQQREREEKERAERKEAANKIHLGGLVFGGGPNPTPGPGLVLAAGAPFNPFATTPATPGGGAAFNPFAVPSAPTAAVSSNPFALPGSSTTTTTTTNTNSSAGSNPFAGLSATASAPAPAAAVSASAPSENNAAAATNSASQDDNSSEDQIISTWPPVASTSSSPPASTPTPVFRPQYVATLYEPSASSSAQASKGKGQRREDELARAFEAELAIRDGGGNAESGRRGGQQSKTAAKDDEADSLDDDEEDRHRPGKGSGGRVKKGAERASASKNPSTGGGGDWAAGEGYEVQRVKGVDDIFLRFQERVSREGRQIVRYDFGAAPLPYSSSSTAYKLVHPPVATNSDLGNYAPSRLPPCRYCRGASTFELQLMPHLALGLDERYEWASVWVLSCEAECPGGVADEEAAAVGEAWREERVLVEWEDEGA
ncbi:hypothetical protein C6P46_005677 [Rhodotorula mucilaginosa]|uniref:Programmed cell death protein 2 C-terminal domain-containing protein n=1 Tax=Rhodotorula mucilaginosa TaxID=5537 RepID=A0A9P7B468_RHOMI|nr:hypothetical protein C6P46_005677 [Rhodotorula mucilaginosa]